MLIVMCGAAASGKSTIAEKYAEIYDATIVSTDAIREELYGDAAIQGNGAEVFNIAYDRLNAILRQEENAIFDATNMSRRARKGILDKAAWYNGIKMLVVVATPVEEIFRRNANRERVVPEEVIMRQLKNFYVPTYDEGWDNISIETSDMFTVEDALNLLKGIAHDNKHHKYDVYEHSVKVWSYFLELNEGYENYWCNAAILHDIGKAYTKAFKDKQGNPSEDAHYYSHANVGAYMSLAIDEIKYPLDIAWIIAHHMDPFSFKTEKQKTNFVEKYGARAKVVLALHEADIAMA